MAMQAVAHAVPVAANPHLLAWLGGFPFPGC